MSGLLSPISLVTFLEEPGLYCDWLQKQGHCPGAAWDSGHAQAQTAQLRHFGLAVLCCEGAILFIVGCLAASLAFTH